MAHWAWVEEKYVQVVDEKDIAPAEREGSTMTSPGQCRMCRQAQGTPHADDCVLVRGCAEDVLVDCIVTQTAENLRAQGKGVEDRTSIITDEVRVPDEWPTAADITTRTAKGFKTFLEATSNPPQEPTVITKEAIDSIEKLITAGDQPDMEYVWGGTDSRPTYDRHAVEALCEKWVDGEDYRDADEVYENGISDMDNVFYELGNDLIGFVREMQNEAIMLMISKNADYGGDADPLRNFKMAPQLGVGVAQGIALRMSDKWARLAGFIKNGELKVKNESVRDTLLDLMNYAGILLFALTETED